jgi:hypothetical protein
MGSKTATRSEAARHCVATGVEVAFAGRRQRCACGAPLADEEAVHEFFGLRGEQAKGEAPSEPSKAKSGAHPSVKATGRLERPAD